MIAGMGVVVFIRGSMSILRRGVSLRVVGLVRRSISTAYILILTRCAAVVCICHIVVGGNIIINRSCGRYLTFYSLRHFAAYTSTKFLLACDRAVFARAVRASGHARDLARDHECFC